MLAQLHPVVVHFPIALLTVYALLELIPWRRTWTDPRWIFVKRILLILGTMGILVALESGEARGGEVFDVGTALAYHARLADITRIIFVLMAGSHVVNMIGAWVTQRVRKYEWAHVSWKVVERIAFFFLLRPVTILLASIGLVVLTITGALGGGMVYGPDADPVVRVVYSLFKLR